MIEMERKFLVKNLDFISKARSFSNIKQGFLNKDPLRTVRIRLKENKGFITVKGLATDQGLSRFEWEKEIDYESATALLALCEKGIINKTRYEILVGTHVFEVDIFHGENNGLILAEIELETPKESFLTPEWLGQEVTGQEKYYNSQLSIKPFSLWGNKG